MVKLSVFDPPMCCSTGVCGPAVDPVLPRFAADLDWLKRQGIEAERYNLAQQPAAFASNPMVRAALHEHGNNCLPLILVDGRVASRGTYPERAELARLAGIETPAETSPRQETASSCCSSPAVVTLGAPASRSKGGCC